MSNIWPHPITIENAVITIFGVGGKLRGKVFFGFVPIAAPETCLLNYEL